MENVIETAVVKPKLASFVNETEYRLISVEDEATLDKGILDIEEYIKNTPGKGKTSEEKDAIYGKAQDLWNDYAKSLLATNYTFYLNRKQYKFLTSLLMDKMEYDVNTLFLAIELTNMLGSWYKSDSADKYKDDKELKGFTADATEVTYMYHLIAKHKVKGLTADSYSFAEVLRKIADISKIIQYYDESSKSMSKSIVEHVAAFEDPTSPNGSLEVNGTVQEVTGTVVTN